MKNNYSLTRRNLIVASAYVAGISTLPFINLLTRERVPKEIKEHAYKIVRITINKNEKLNHSIYIETPIRPIHQIFVNGFHGQPKIEVTASDDHIKISSQTLKPEGIHDYSYDVYLYRNDHTILRMRLFIHINTSNQAINRTREPPTLHASRVLVVTIDDMLNVYNRRNHYNHRFLTPNFDRLLNHSTAFTNANATTPLCGPSRASMWSGQPTLKHRFLYEKRHWSQCFTPEISTPGQLKNSGYQVALYGKFFHEATSLNPDYYNKMATHWAQPLGFRSAMRAPHKDRLKHNPFTRHHGPDNELADSNTTQQAIDFLRNRLNPKDPFFLGVGFYKPHLSWGVPERYFEMIDLDEISLPLLEPDDGADIPPWAKLHMGQFIGTDNNPSSIEQWKRAIQAYMAALAYSDAQLGLLLDTLEELELDKGCAIIVASDHGYHLGDKDRWRKYTLWENSINTPLLISLPNPDHPDARLRERKKKTHTHPVSLADIHSTVLDLANIQENEEITSQSLVTAALEPENAAFNTRQAILTTIGNSASIRTLRHRYTLYEDGSRELYNIEYDPFSSVNLSGTSENQALEKNLHSKLKSLIAEQTPKGVKTILAGH